MKNKEKELIKIHEQILELNEKKYIILKEYIEQMFKYIEKNNITINDIKNIKKEKYDKYWENIKKQGNNIGLEKDIIKYDLKLPTFCWKISEIDFDFLK